MRRDLARAWGTLMLLFFVIGWLSGGWFGGRDVALALLAANIPIAVLWQLIWAQHGREELW